MPPDLTEILHSYRDSYLRPDKDGNIKPFKAKLFSKDGILSRCIANDKVISHLKKIVAKEAEKLHLLSEFRERIRDTFYVTSFSKGFSSPQMWGLYADSSKGVCLQFDFRIPKDDPFVGEVHYVEKPFDGMADVLLSYVISNSICKKKGMKKIPKYPNDILVSICSQLFQKSKMWSEEQEVRFVAGKEQINDLKNTTYPTIMIISCVCQSLAFGI